MDADLRASDHRSRPGLHREVLVYPAPGGLSIHINSSPYDLLHRNITNCDNDHAATTMTLFYQVMCASLLKWLTLLHKSYNTGAKCISYYSPKSGCYISLFNWKFGMLSFWLSFVVIFWRMSCCL